MHERNPYRNGIDFVALAESFPPLKPYLVRTGKDVVTINFKDSDGQRRLTEALLARDFNLRISLPEGRLCPPVPNRLNYILWIQDLLDATFNSLSLAAGAVEVVGVDIGTGASAIYPLLACTRGSRWKLFGTEIDATSYESALTIVTQNNLTDRISVVRASPSDNLFKPILTNKYIKFTFTMCNPPFYGSAEEVERSAEGKAMEPNAVCTGAEVEMITPGGESAFVRRMVEESLQLRNRCIWYTSMLGKLSSVGEVIESLRSHQIDNYAVTELTQGQTRRWVVAWSFGDARVTDKIARSLPTIHHALLPLPNCLTQSYPSVHSATQLRATLDDVLQGVEGVQFSPARLSSTSTTDASTPETEEDKDFAIRVEAAANTWSRAARRRAKQTRTLLTGTEIENERPQLVVLVRSLTSPQSQNWYSLECIWLRGHDRSLFESFWAHVSRKVGAGLEKQAKAV